MTLDVKEVDAKAHKRMAVILQVEAGLMTATDGAKALGISRQAYYEWANRALTSMAESLGDRSAGRPALPQDAEKDRMEKELSETKADLERAMLALDIKKTLETLRREETTPRTSGRDGKKNTKSGRKARKH